MNYRPLGKTGLHVSIISLGTVSLSVDYGIEAPGEFGRPAEMDAVRLLQQAADAGMGILIRSALLKGVLTSKAPWLPTELAELRRAAERARDILAVSWQSLPEAALRFCLSAPQVSTVLARTRTLEELRQALAAAWAGPLLEEVLARTPALALEEECWLNPSCWSVV